MNKKNNTENIEKYSNPKSIPLAVDVNDIKLPDNTIVDKKRLIAEIGEEKTEEYGRPDLSLTADELEMMIIKEQEKNKKIIDESFSREEIDKETYDFLTSYYCNIKDNNSLFQRKLSKFLGASPKSIKYINLTNGEIDNDTAYFEEHVSFNTSMVYEYEIEAPWRLENKIPNEPMSKISLKIIKPQMKSLERAIEKVKIGGKYDMERKNELAKLKNGRTMEELDKGKLRKPIQRLKDIYRCSVLAPRYDDVVALYSYGLDKGYADKSSRPSKYLNNDPKNAQAFFKNNKNYRDCKNYWKLGKDDAGNEMYFEVLYKLEKQFFKADVITHIEYEKARKNQQKFYNALTEGDKLVYNKKIFKHMLNISQINSKLFEEYNLDTFRDVYIMEKKLKKAHVVPREDGSYDLCHQLLEKCMIVRSSKALTDETFQSAPAWIKDIYSRYSNDIDDKYLVDIRKRALQKGAQMKRPLSKGAQMKRHLPKGAQMKRPLPKGAQMKRPLPKGAQMKRHFQR